MLPFSSEVVELSNHNPTSLERNAVAARTQGGRDTSLHTTTQLLFLSLRLGHKIGSEVVCSEIMSSFMLPRYVHPGTFPTSPLGVSPTHSRSHYRSFVWHAVLCRFISSSYPCLLNYLNKSS